MSINIDAILTQEKLELTQDSVLPTLTMLAREPKFDFALLIDMFGIDYGINAKPRFAVMYNLLSLSNNHRLQIMVPLTNNMDSAVQLRNDDTAARDGNVATKNDGDIAQEIFALPSVCAIWPNANWYEREIYDMFGITFTDHPDLRRIITEYNYDKHPLRKDFKK